MSGSGELLPEVLLTLFYLYVFRGGWAITLIGLAFCVMSKIRGANWSSTCLLAGACLTPIAVYALGIGTADNLPTMDASAAGIWGCIALFAALVFCGPVWAVWLMLRTRPSQAHNEGPI